MTTPLVDVVIACHDEARPIERAVASVLQDADVRERVRVTVVAHGLPAEPFESRLSALDVPAGSWRVVAFADGIRSPAGPFNHGIDLADADYVAVMGSDDFLEPGAMSAWLRHVDAERPAAAIARIRIQGQTVMPNPLVRLGRRRRMDAAKDRLFYRTAPLGLIETAEVRRLGLRMTEGMRVGEDVEFGITLWSLGRRIDFLRDAPSYVIGVDAAERTTHARLPIEETFEPITRLLDDGLPSRLPAAHRRALAVKLARVGVVGAARSRPLPEHWRGDDEVAALAALLRRLIAISPRLLVPFNLADRRVLDGLLAEPTVARVTADARHPSAAGRRERWLTKNPLHSLDRESTLRRYLLYFLKRERVRTASP
ncbi:MAG: glycosyltransferase [Microbacterium sp.]